MQKSNSGRSWTILFVIFCCLFLVTRLAVLWYSPMLEQGEEELVNGVLPFHLDQGLLMPFYMYQYESYSGGSMVIGLVAWPFFKIFGPTYFALKLAALTFSFLCFMVTVLFARKYFDSPAWIFVAALFIFAPRFFIERSLVSYGNHMEVALFYSAFLFFVYFAFVHTDRTHPAAISKFIIPLIAGLTSGFACYFDYQFALLLAVFAPLAFASVRSLRSIVIPFALFLLGFKIGLSPWYAYHGDSSFLSQVVGFYSSGPEKAGNFFRAIFETDYSGWFGSKELRIAGRIIIEDNTIDKWLFRFLIISYGYLAVRSRNVAVDFIKGLIPKRKTRFAWTTEHKYVPLLVYVPIHLVLFAQYTYNYPLPVPPFRYLNPVFIFYFLITALAAADLWSKDRRKLGTVAICVPLLFSTIGSVGLFEEAEPGALQSRQGYSYQYFYGAMQNVYSAKIEGDRYIKIGREGFSEHRQNFWAGVSAGVSGLNGIDISGHIEFHKAQGDAPFAAFTSGLGVSTSISSHKDGKSGFTLQNIIPVGNLSDFNAGRSLGDYISGKIDMITEQPDKPTSP